MSNVINKKDLAEKLAEEFGCSKKKTQQLMFNSYSIQ